jgi:hypothetical protein
MHLQLWISLMLSQLFGAFIFWHIDSYIFTSQRFDQKTGKNNQPVRKLD